MTIVEALKISDIVRRVGSARIAGSHGNGWINIHFMPRMTKEELLADDWEAQEECKMITVREVGAAFQYCQHYGFSLERLLMKLGFEE